MAFEQPLFQISRVCGTVSLATKQYHFVKLHTDGTVLICAAATDRPIGVLQNAPAVGEEATIMVIGISKVSSDAALAIDVAIGPSSDGQADAKTVTTDATEYVCGRVLTASLAAAGLVTALIDCMAPHRAA